MLVGKCFNDEFKQSLFSHCSAFYGDIIICLVFIIKGEIFARVTVFTLEHQLFHLCNKEKKAKKKK